MDPTDPTVTHPTFSEEEEEKNDAQDNPKGTEPPVDQDDKRQQLQL
jgi:hypothetical protein